MAYAELAGTRFLGGAFSEAIEAGERALALAAALGLPEQARALGFRGSARCSMGDRQGLEDIRRALELALEQGRGRSAAVLHNNLAIAVWMYEGPGAALASCQEGLAFCQRRGIDEFALAIGCISTTLLAECGSPEEALAEAGPLAERMEGAGDINFIEPRSLQLRLLVERGEHDRAEGAEELVVKARETEHPDFHAMAFSAVARLMLVQNRPDEARALLVEIEHVAGIRAGAYYVSLLPEVVRTALALDDVDLAARLVDGVEPRAALFDHAVFACRAQLAEACGEHAEAAALYAECAERWREFGNVPECVYALLGRGRCLAALGKPEAEEPLREARELFGSMGYAPAVAKTDALLGESEAAAV